MPASNPGAQHKITAVDDVVAPHSITVNTAVCIIRINSRLTCRVQGDIVVIEVMQAEFEGIRLLLLLLPKDDQPLVGILPFRGRVGIILDIGELFLSSADVTCMIVTDTGIIGAVDLQGRALVGRFFKQRPSLVVALLPVKTNAAIVGGKHIVRVLVCSNGEVFRGHVVLFDFKIEQAQVVIQAR